LRLFATKQTGPIYVTLADNGFFVYVVTIYLIFVLTAYVKLSCQ